MFEIFEDLYRQAERNVKEDKYVLALVKLCLLMDLAVRYDYHQLSEASYLQWLEDQFGQQSYNNLTSSILKIRNHMLQGHPFNAEDNLPIISLRKQPVIFRALLDHQEHSFIHLAYLSQILLDHLLLWLKKIPRDEDHQLFDIKQGLIYGDQQILITNKQ